MSSALAAGIRILAERDTVRAQLAKASPQWTPAQLDRCTASLMLARGHTAASVTAAAQAMRQSTQPATARPL